MFQIFMSFSVIFDKEHWDRPPATRQRGVSLTERLGAQGAGFISGPALRLPAWLSAPQLSDG